MFSTARTNASGAKESQVAFVKSSQVAFVKSSESGLLIDPQNSRPVSVLSYGSKDEANKKARDGCPEGGVPVEPIQVTIAVGDLQYIPKVVDSSGTPMVIASNGEAVTLDRLMCVGPYLSALTAALVPVRPKP